MEITTAHPSIEIAPWFSFTVVPAREAVQIEAAGELDLAAAPRLQGQVSELVEAGFDQVVVDLRRVTFIDLTGVRLLVKLTQDAGDAGWRLSLIQAGGQVRQMLTLTGVLDQLPIRTTLVKLPVLAQA